MALHIECVGHERSLGARVRCETVLFLKDAFLAGKDIEQDREKNYGAHQIQKDAPHRTCLAAKGSRLVQINAAGRRRLARKTKRLTQLGPRYVSAERTTIHNLGRLAGKD